MERRSGGQEKSARWKQGSGKEWEQRIEMGRTEEECWRELGSGKEGAAENKG